MRRSVPAASESQASLGCCDAWHLNQPRPGTCYYMLLHTWSRMLLQLRGFGEVPSAAKVKGHLEAFTMGTASSIPLQA